MRSAAAAQPLDLEVLRSRQLQLASKTRAPLTLRNYGYDWVKYEKWCQEKHLTAFPTTDDTLSLFLVHLLEELRYKVTTAQRMGAAVVYRHKAEGLDTPLGPMCRAIISATKRIRKEKPSQRTPITVDQLRQISKAYGAMGTNKSIRNRAIMVFGFACAMRRSNLVALQLSDISFTREGVVVQERSSKTDQFGKGREIGIFYGKHRETCPVRCLKAWLRARGNWRGALFNPITQGDVIEHRGMRHTGQAIHKVVQAAVKMIGQNPEQYGAHSLRAGLVTAAVEAGASELSIMRITGHRQIETLKRYNRPIRVFPNRNVLADAL